MIEELKTIIINNATTIAILMVILKLFIEIDKSDKIKFSPIKSIKHFFVGDLKEQIDNNRASEIKYELASYLKLAEEGKNLSENDIAFVRDIYDEYHNKLNRNHLGTIMYEKIEKHYSEQIDKKENI